MDVDQDLPEGTTPPGTPFANDHTAHQQGGGPSVDPPEGVPTNNFFTPLYKESQENDNTTANTGHLTPHPLDARLATINEAEEEELAAAAAAEAKAHRTTELEAKTTTMAAEAKTLAASAEAHRTAELEAQAAAWRPKQRRWRQRQWLRRRHQPH